MSRVLCGESKPIGDLERFVINRMVNIMETIEVSKNDVKKLTNLLETFVHEDRNSCDYCVHCGMEYGNALLLEKQGKKLTHESDCPILIIQDMATGL